MERTSGGSVPLTLRRALAVIEFAAAGFLLLLSVDGLLSTDRVGGDGIATGLLSALALPFMVIAAGVAVAAYAAWTGRRRWWVWQAALPVWVCVVLVVTTVVLAEWLK